MSERKNRLSKPSAPRRRALLLSSAGALIALAACASVGAQDGSESSAVTGSDDQARAGDAGARPPRPLRDWCRYPVVREVDDVSELYAVSDIHADYAALTTLLSGAGLISEAPEDPRWVRWTGGDAALVVVGDSIDRGPDAVNVLRLLMTLERTAPLWGGQVIVTMGNHEAEFLANPENGAAMDGAVGIDRELVEAGYSVDATAEGEDRIGRFLYDLPIGARVGDWFFVHAGNTHGQSIAQITSAVQAGLDADGFGSPVLSASTSLLETKFVVGSPTQWWDATGDAKALLTAWTQALGVQHLVMGHQPQAVTITGGPKRAQDVMAAEFGGLLFFVDTGMSVGVDHTGGGLLHVTDVGGPTEAWEEVMPDGSSRAL
jgi:hypothetical protein